jgi:hypothetical protein
MRVQATHNRPVCMPCEPAPHNQAGVSAGAAAAVQRLPQVQQRREPAAVNTGVRAWQFTSHYPLAKSRLEFAVRGQTLIVSCKTLADAGHMQDVGRNVILFGCVVAVDLLAMLESGPDHGCVSQGFPATLILIVYLMYALAGGVVRSYLKPQLLISPEGWSLSYCSLGRPSLQGFADNNCNESDDRVGQVQETALNSPSGVGMEGAEAASRLTIGAHECASSSPKASNEACVAADTCSHTAACIHVAPDAPRSPFSGHNACRRSSCSANRSTQHSAVQRTGNGCTQCSRSGAGASAEFRGAQVPNGGKSARIHGRGMQESNVSSHGGSDGPLPASQNATNNALASASHASLSASHMHDEHACSIQMNSRVRRGRSSPADVGCMHGGWISRIVCACMELCGRGEPLRDVLAWEPVLGAKVLLMLMLHVAAVL